MFPGVIRCYVEAGSQKCAVTGAMMATISDQLASETVHPDFLTGTPRGHGLDRWIFFLSAALFIIIVLVGFIPDSLMKIELVRAGQRAPFPAILHVHAVVMGSFLLFLLSQTWLVATGRCELHRKVGPIGGALAVLLVVVGFIVAPTMYHQVWDAIPAAPADVQAKLRDINRLQDNILLLQLRIGILFPLFLWLGLRARDRDSGFHKRMMIIAPAMALPAAFDRMTWIPHTFPANPLSTDLYPLLALAPLVAWDVIRNRRIHRAYWWFLIIYVPVCVLVHIAFDTVWWHDWAHRIMGA